ncbi:MAG: transposase [Verrucomicrobiota bacterium]
MVIAPDSTPLSLEQALALLGESRRQWDAEKRLLELRIQSLEHRLFGTKSEKVALEDKQLALIDEVFTHPEPAATEDVVVVPDIEKRVAKKPVRKPLPEHLECVEISSGCLHLACSWTAKLSGKEGGGGE